MKNSKIGIYERARAIFKSSNVLNFRRLTDTARMPKEDGVGVDLFSDENVVIRPGKRVMVKTGLMGSIPSGFVGLVYSALNEAMRYGVVVINSPDVIDSSYNEEWKVLLMNLTDWHYHVKIGDRIGKLLIVPHEPFMFVEGK
jgi:dUTP pyrophosphatase